MSGPAAGALRAFAYGEGISLGEAADAYLTQVASRLGATGITVDSISAPGHDVVTDLLDAVTTTGARRLAIPASTKALGRRGLAELTTASPVPVVVAPAT
jgi:hypothetical protein